MQIKQNHIDSACHQQIKLAIPYIMCHSGIMNQGFNKHYLNGIGFNYLKKFLLI